MDLEELRAFLDVVQTGSFLAAADTLGVSRTTLRRRVEALEARAGVPLLKSTRQGVILTQAGEVLAQRGRIVMQETSALLASIREAGQEPSGLLRVVMPVGPPVHVVAMVLRMLRSAYPLLRVYARFSDNPLNEPLDDVDMALHFGDEPPKGPWVSHEVRRYRDGLLASREYLKERAVPQSLDDLHDHELLSWEPPGADARAWPTLQGSTFMIEPVCISTDLHLIRHCCISGLGIALIPIDELPDPNVPEDHLVHLLPDLVGRELTFRVSVPKALTEVPKVKRVLAHVLGAMVLG